MEAQFSANGSVRDNARTLLDMSNADLGHEFKIVGGPWDGESGHSLDFVYYDAGVEDVIDEFEALVTDHVRVDLGPVATYVPRHIWTRMDGASR